MSLKDIDQNKLSIAVNSAFTVLSAGTDAINTAKQIATATTNFYTAFIKNTGISGDEKKSIVLSLLEQTWDTILTGSNQQLFSDWAKKIGEFIDLLHSAYNSLITDLTAIKNVLFGVSDAIHQAQTSSNPSV